MPAAMWAFASHDLPSDHMKQLIALAFVLVFACMAELRAAEADRADTEATEPSGPQTNTTKATSDAKQADKGSEEFTPSEEISEDFAVSFPVDI